MIRVRQLCLLFVLLLAQLAVAHDDPAVVAFLSFGTSPAPWSVSEELILEELVHAGLLSEEEFAQSENRGDLVGENVAVFALDAGWELNQLGIMIETALDREADVLVAFTTPVARAAINATYDMDDPPAIIFVSARHPYIAGLADAPCIKPDHVTGLELEAPYEQVVNLVRQQQPDITSLGVVFSVDQIAGQEGARLIAALGEAQGIKVVEAAVTQPIDFIAAVDGLVSRGVEAIIMTIDTVTSRGLPAIVSTASENLIPVFYPSFGGISGGAMISAGTYRHVEQGINAGRMVSAYLRGELDTAATAIDSIGGDGVGVNLIVAETLRIEIRPEILDSADVIFNHEGITYSPRLSESIANDEAYANSETRAEDARVYLESLTCTAEMIAEQQAQLEAAS